MLEELKIKVCRANKDLKSHGLVLFTWGNVSAVDRESGYVVIKASGIEYDALLPELMTVVDLEGNIIEGRYKPSSDTPTHLALYKDFTDIGGIVHTHSTWATIRAQAGLDIPPYGTTHADYFYGAVPCTRALSLDEVNGAYEEETGRVIIETFRENNLNPFSIPAVLVRSHGPFAWGKSAEEAVHNAAVLEQVAQMAYHTEKAFTQGLNRLQPIPQTLLDRHYLRKHGDGAYYGQG